MSATADIETQIPFLIIKHLETSGCMCRNKFKSSFLSCNLISELLFRVKLFSYSPDVLFICSLSLCHCSFFIEKKKLNFTGTENSCDQKAYLLLKSICSVLILLQPLHLLDYVLSTGAKACSYHFNFPSPSQPLTSFCHLRHILVTHMTALQ